ncbi:MAG: hypothetical protein U1E39_09605 [Planctomycetota bacterium]
MRTFLSLVGGFVAAAVASAAVASADPVSRDDFARRAAAVPAEVDVSTPRAALTGGAGEAWNEGNPCCAPCPTFSLTIGAWIWGVEGTVGDNGRKIDVDSDWTDTLDMIDKIEFAADVRARLKTGRWSFTLEVDGAKIADSAEFHDGLFAVDGEMSLWTLQGQVGYNLAGGNLSCSPCSPVGCLEAYVGARAWWVDLEVDGVGTAAPGARIDSSKSWVDPIVGLRGDLSFGGRWFAVVEADVGGFGVGSDFSWHVMAALGFKFNDHVAVELGWKHLDVDYEDGAYVFDVALSGPFLAFTFTF